jgi:hypothetical protein
MSEALPEGFPANTSDVQLVLCVVAATFPDKLVPIVENIYRQYWEEGKSSVLTQAGFTPILEAEIGVGSTKSIIEVVSYTHL